MILAVDLGTSSAKAALFSRKGDVLAVGSSPIDKIASPQSGVSADPMAQEVDAEAWSRAFARLLPDLRSRAAQAEAGRGNEALECIAVSGNGPSLVPVGDSGLPLAPAITWMDRRAVTEAAMASKVAGRPLDPTYNLPKALWFKRFKPDMYERTARFSSCPEYLCGRLTGCWRTFLPAQGFQPIIWDSASLRALGLDESKFPPFIGLGQVLGRVSLSASREFGIPEGIPVVSGGPDFVVSLIGTATTRPGRACDRAGSSEGINLCHEGSFPQDSRLLVMPHVIEPYLNVSGAISTTGRALAWFMEASRAGGGDFEELFDSIGMVEPGAGRLVFLPYLAGERAPLWDPDARAAFLGLNLTHRFEHMARAVAESAGYAIRDVVEAMGSRGAKVSELRVSGGPARNPAWNQIKADITGLPLLVPRFPHAELMGDLCLALSALGDYPGPAEAAETLVTMERAHEPIAALRSLYDDLFGAYQEGYRALKPVFARLAAGQRPSGQGSSGRDAVDRNPGAG
ncbi:MAG TPA: FGGY-family carbohydrate kinase [Rectinemataceae bacterium]